jgi:transcriptional regulator with XRE-family HTH domain
MSTTIGRALALARQKGLNQSEFAREVGATPQDVTNWKRRGAIPADRYVAVAKGLGCSVDYLAGEVNEHARHLNEGVARYMGLSDAKVPPQVIAWVDLMDVSSTGTLPQEFRTYAPDDALAPRLKAGQRITLDAREMPRPGDCVLIEDRTGAHHLRIFTQGVGTWTGEATNQNGYASLEAIRDGLRVVAVLTESAGRWG